MKAWVKGGLWGAGIGVVLSIIFELVANIEVTFLTYISIVPIFIFAGISFLLVQFIFGPLFSCPKGSWWALRECSSSINLIAYILSALLTLGVFFLIGSFIGRIIEKVKSKK